MGRGRHRLFLPSRGEGSYVALTRTRRAMRGEATKAPHTASEHITFARKATVPKRDISIPDSESRHRTHSRSQED